MEQTCIHIICFETILFWNDSVAKCSLHVTHLKNEYSTDVPIQYQPSSIVDHLRPEPP